MKNDFNIPELHKDLLERCLRNDTAAQLQLYKMYCQSMYNISLRIVGNPGEAEDVTQEAFISAFDKLRSFKAEVSFGAWLKRIVINKSIDAVRRKKRIPEEPTESFSTELAEEEPEFEVSEELSALIRKEIALLPEGYRMVLSLHLLEGYDYDEISGILNISPSSVRSQFMRGRQKLYLNLKNREPGH